MDPYTHNFINVPVTNVPDTTSLSAQMKARHQRNVIGCPHLPVNGFDLLQGGEHKHGRFAHTRLGLTQDVHPKNGLRNAFVLDCGHKRYKYKYAFLLDCGHKCYKFWVVCFKSAHHTIK